MVFTIPQILRPYFLYDRKLLTELSRAPHRAVSRFVEMTAGAGARPAMAVVKHTFGEGVRFHPHLGSDPRFSKHHYLHLCKLQIL
jgi:hypothetical protein